MQHYKSRYFMKPSICVAVYVLFTFATYGGNGYIDNRGAWHFSVAFIQPVAGLPIDEQEWLEILKEADEILYRMSRGTNQIGSINRLASQRYDATVDLVIINDPARSYADVYGINRLGYHLFISDQIRNGRSRTEVATLVVHMLGHYLYSLYDEYRNRRGLPVPQQCINRLVSIRPIDDAACLMERFRPDVGAWCYRENHEIAAANLQLAFTWQSEDNDSLSCWSTLKRLYPVFFGTLANPVLQDSVNMSGFLPLEILERNPGTEFVVAIDAGALQNPADPAFLFTLQTVLRAVASAPIADGAVMILVYSGSQVSVSNVLTWDQSLVRNIISHIPSVPDVGGASLEIVLQGALTAFDSTASRGGGGSVRTLLLLTSGTESSVIPNPLTLNRFQREHIRSLIGFVRPTVRLDTSIVAGYSRVAARIGGTIFDSTFPSVRAYMATKAGSRETIAVETALLTSGGTSASLEYAFQDSVEQSFLSASWTDPNCDVEVSLIRNGVLEVINPDNPDDVVGIGLKGRRVSRLGGDEKLELRATAPDGCAGTPIPVTFAIADDKPSVYFSVLSERPFYGTDDNEVVHARALAPYPLFNLDEFVVGQIDSLGNFLLNEFAPATDDGVTNFGSGFFEGDWVEGDGIHSKIYRTISSSVLRTVKFRARNFGQARLVPGEEFSDGPSTLAIPRFQREAFVTYFVDLDAKDNTTLGLEEFDLASLPWPPAPGNLTASGTFALPTSYPHAFSIEGKIVSLEDTTRALNMKFDAGSYEVDLDFCKLIPTLCRFPPQLPDTLAVRAIMAVRYRTGDALTYSFTYKRFAGGDMIMAVDDLRQNASNLPEELRLGRNYPNPFNLSTRIEFTLPRAANVTVEILDVTGAMIRRILSDQWLGSGTHALDWDGRTERGTVASSGVHYVRLRNGDQSRVEKILLLK